MLAAFSSADVSPFRDAATIASLRALTCRMSMPISPPITTPYSAARRAIRAALALATKALVGVQPVLTQVPPTRWRSTTATVIPAPARRNAKDGPAWPVPMMIASKSGMTSLSSSRRRYIKPVAYIVLYRPGGGGKGVGCHLVIHLLQFGFHTTILRVTLPVPTRVEPAQTAS